MTVQEEDGEGQVEPAFIVPSDMCIDYIITHYVGIRPWDDKGSG